MLDWRLFRPKPVFEPIVSALTSKDTAPVLSFTAKALVLLVIIFTDSIVMLPVVLSVDKKLKLLVFVAVISWVSLLTLPYIFTPVEPPKIGCISSPGVVPLVL